LIIRRTYSRTVPKPQGGENARFTPGSPQIGEFEVRGDRAALLLCVDPALLS
jgi:hypothetical protein